MRLRLLAAALWILPEDERKGVGAELEGMVLDAQPQSWPRYLLELMHVVRFGASHRATQTAAAGVARVLLDGASRGALVLCAVLITSAPFAVFAPLTSPPTPALIATSIVLIAVVLGLGLICADRAAGLVGILWILHPVLLGEPNTWRFEANLLMLLIFGAMVVFPRRTARRPWRLVWLNLPVWSFVLATGSVLALTIILALIAGILLMAAVLGLAHDPRWAIAGCVVVAYMYSGGPTMSASGTLVSGLAAATAWVTAAWFTRVRRPAPGSPA